MEYNIVPVWDFNRHTALEIRRTEKKVWFIPLDTSQAFHVQEKSVAHYEFIPINFYPHDKAIRHFQRMAKEYGATKEVCKVLGIEWVARAEVPSTEVLEQSPQKTRETPRKFTQAMMFRELIMEGKLTVEEIYQAVVAAFELQPVRKCYVVWYHKELTKQGKNPPPLKGLEVKLKKEKQNVNVQGREKVSKKVRDAQPESARACDNKKVSRAVRLPKGGTGRVSGRGK
jgi:hypothetical protein